MEKGDIKMKITQKIAENIAASRDYAIKAVGTHVGSNITTVASAVLAGVAGYYSGQSSMEVAKMAAGTAAVSLSLTPGLVPDKVAYATSAVAIAATATLVATKFANINVINKLVSNSIVNLGIKSATFAVTTHAVYDLVATRVPKEGGDDSAHGK